MASELLKHYRALTANDTQAGNSQKQLLALWGSLACCVRYSDRQESRISLFLFVNNQH